MVRSSCPQVVLTIIRVMWYRLSAVYGLMRGELLSNSAATGVHQQSISRTFQSIDLSQLVVSSRERSMDQNVLDIHRLLMNSSGWYTLLLNNFPLIVRVFAYVSFPVSLKIHRLIAICKRTPTAEHTYKHSNKMHWGRALVRHSLSKLNWWVKSNSAVM